MPANSQKRLNSLIKRQILIIALIFPPLITNMTGCTTQTSSNNNSQATPRSQVSIEKIPSTLKIVFIVSTDDPQRQERQETLAEYLKKTLKQPVSIEGTKDYNTAVDLLVKEKVQVAVLGPLTYLQAKERNPKIEPIVVPINKSTGRPWYKSVIVINSGSGIKTINDLKGKRLGFVNKQSTSGYMFPVIHLLDIGFDFDSDFASVEFFKSHDKTLAALLNGKVDAIAIESKFYDQAKESGTINDSYPVIWQSEPIPEFPVVVSQKLPPELIIQLKEAFISVPIGMLSLEGIPSNGYTLVQDSDYDRVKQVKKQLDEKLGNKK